VALPEQIRKQSEAVQQLYADMNPDPDAPKGEGGDDFVQISDAPADVQQPNAAAPPVVEQKAGGERVEDETLTQKYKTLQGMFNAEVPRLQGQTREQAQRIQQLEQLLASVAAQQRQKPAEPVAPAALVSEAEAEEYGASIDVMRKVSREEIAPILQKFANIEGMLQQLQQSQATVVPQLQQVQQRQAVTAEQQFWADLTGAVSTWREVNDNPDFQQWLLQADPLTGITRQTYLEDAQRALDARRVANFFSTWLEKVGPQVAQPTGRANPQSELERQVAPGKSKNTGAPASNKGKSYTRDDIAKFYKDIALGAYKGREDERARIEKDIFAAQRDERIT